MSLPNGQNRTAMPEPPTVDFDVLYREHASAVARWSLRLAPAVDADDVVQEVFCVVHRRLASLRAGVQPRTWLFGITTRIVQSQRRKQQILRRLSRTQVDVLDGLPLVGPTPIEAFEQRQAIAMAYRALEHLREKHRQAFIFFELEGMSVQEISELMGTKAATIKVWLHRARQAFVARLAKQRREGKA